MDPVDTVDPAAPADDLIISKYGKLLGNVLRDIPVAMSMIDGWDNWLLNKINHHVDARSSYIGANSDAYVKFGPVTIVPAYRTHHNVTKPFTPMNARHSKTTYFLEVRVHITVYKGGTREDPCAGQIIAQTEKPEIIGKIPCMMKSRGCHLYGKTDEEIIEMQEDPRDPGGYFIVDGIERTIFLTEMLRVNTFVIGIDSKQNPPEEFIATTMATTRGTVLTTLRVVHPQANIKQSLIHLNINNVRSYNSGKKRIHNTINVFKAIRLYTVLRKLDEGHIAFFRSPYNVLRMVLQFVKPERHARVKVALADTISAALVANNEYDEMKGIVTRGRVIDKTTDVNAMILHALESSILSHEDVNNPIKKIFSMCMMIAQIGEYLAGFRKITEKDSWENKRLLTPSIRCEQLFRGLWKCFVRESLKNLLKVQVLPANIMGQMFTGISLKYVTDGFHSSFTGPRWGVKTVNVQEDNPVQILQHKTFMEMIMMLSRINVDVDRKTKSLTIRAVQPTQWGYVDISDSTESSAIGIIKAMTITTHVTHGVPPDKIIKLVTREHKIMMGGMEATHYYVTNAYDPGSAKTDVLLVNGLFIGWCNGVETRNLLVMARRENVIDRMTCVLFNEHGYVLVNCDEGRLVRPLLIVDQNGDLVLEKKNELKPGLWDADLNTLLEEHCIEYIDALEQTTIRVAALPESLEEWKTDVQNFRANIEKERLNLQEHPGDRHSLANLQEYEAELAILLANPYTHCEIHPQALFAPSLTTKPFLNFTQAPRISFQSQMGRQALGTPAIGGQFRFDNDAKYLLRPTRPLVTQQLEKYLHLDKFPHGVTMSLAFLSIKGETIEDAFKVRRKVAQYGYLDIANYFVIETIVGRNEILTKPTNLIKGEDASRYQFLTNQGLPMKNAPLIQGDYIIGKVYNNPKTNEVKNMSVVLKVGESGIVDTVHVVDGGRSTRVLVKIRRDRSHQVSDKMASRYAQKATTAAITPEEDLPFDEETGEIADIYTNPHCFVGDTLVTLANGTSVEISKMGSGYIGVDVLSLDKSNAHMDAKACSYFIPQGKGQTVKVQLEDGRILHCTPDHKILTYKPANPTLFCYIKAAELPLDGSVYIVSGYEGVKDEGSVADTAMCRLMGAMRGSQKATRHNLDLDAINRDFTVSKCDPNDIYDTVFTLAILGKLDYFNLREYLAAYLGCVAKIYYSGIYISKKYIESYLPFFERFGVTLEQKGSKGYVIKSFSTFAEKMGFRYAIVKSMQLGALVSYEKSILLQPGKFKESVFDFLERTGAKELFETQVEQDGSCPIPNFGVRPTSITSGGEHEVYDISVVKHHNFAANGLIVSNSIPKRMTLGFILEPLFGMVAALTGQRFNASAFEKFNTDEAYRTLQRFGFDPQGYRWFVHPHTGIRQKAMVFMGPVYHQILYHLGPEKLQMRSSGVVKLLTHQPPRGTAFGGRRVGEMERNLMISHGAANFMIDLLVTKSDAYKTVFCKTCGNFATVRGGVVRAECNICKGGGEFVKNTIPYVYKLLVQLMFGAGIYIHLDYTKIDKTKEEPLVRNLPTDLQKVKNLEDDGDLIDEELGAEEQQVQEDDMGVVTGEEDEGEAEQANEDGEDEPLDAIMGMGDENAGYFPAEDFYGMDDEGEEMGGGEEDGGDYYGGEE